MSLRPEALVDMLRAAGEPTRLRILCLLQEGDLSVGELVEILGQSQPRLSHHLRVLTKAGLVERLPEGAWVFHRLVRSGSAGRCLDMVLGEIDAEDPARRRDRGRLSAIRAARNAEADAYFSQVADTWDTIRALHYPEGAIEAALKDIVGPAPIRHLIDIGTGTGRMLTLFAPQAERAEGVDLSHRMLTIARAKLAAEGLTHAQVRQGDALALPFEDGIADLVIVHQVLHYIDRPGRVLAEIDRLLMPGGRAIIIDFAPHDHDFLREAHGHRRLGIQDEAMAGWIAETSLTLKPPRRFDPPDERRDGLAVQIWTAEKPRAAEEAAA